MAEYLINKYLKKRTKRPVSDYYSDELLEAVDDYVEYNITQIEQARKGCDEPFIGVELKVSLAHRIEGCFGTADMVVVDSHKIHIIDLKLGKGVVVDAEQNVQLMIYGLGVLDMLGFLYEIDTVELTIVQPRIEHFSTWEISAGELLAWGKDVLEPGAAKALSGEGEFKAGDHCRFCKARFTCRARAEEYLKLAQMEFAEPARMSDEEITEVLSKADALKKWAEEVYTYAQNEAVVNHKEWPGYKLVLGRSNRKYTDEEDVAEAAQKAGYKPREGAEEKIYELISDISISMKAVDYLDMPECVCNRVSVSMSESEQALYDRMADEMILEYGEGQDIDAVNAAALSNKLQQMANGAVYDESGNVRNIHDRKLDALEDLIESANGKPLLVAYWFKHDRERILKRFPARDINTKKDIDDWNAGKIPVALIHPASAGHGLNLQEGGSTIVWFSLTWSLELYQQLNARLYRQGQKHTVVIEYLVTDGTVDEDILRAIERKDNTQNAMIEAVKARIGGMADDGRSNDEGI